MRNSKSTIDTSSAWLIARILTGAWRLSPPVLVMTDDEIANVSPLLIGSGAGSLGWWRLRESERHCAQITAKFQQAFQSNVLRAAMQELFIKRVFTSLQSKGIHPVLIKGWAVGQFYAQPALRYSGDLDLVVKPGQTRLAAETVMRNPKDYWFHVDIHEDFSKFGESDTENLYANTEMIQLDDVAVRVLRPEDHLRLLSAHLLRHGAWRPLWLCDIAAAVENRPANFDWERCLGADKRRARWVTCVVGLAHKLLGAKIDDAPIAREAKRLPKWLVPSVLRQWEKPYAWEHEAFPLMATHLRHPSALPAALRRRWADPIRATVNVGGSFNELPRFPFQVCDYLQSTAKFLSRLPSALQQP